MKRLIVIIGPNGVGKSTTAQSLLNQISRSAYVDSDWCRVINPFPATDETRKAITDNIYCLLRNYLVCKDIQTVIFPYGFHGDRKARFDEVMQRLNDNHIEFSMKFVIIKCTLEENIKRAKKDRREEERIWRGIKNTFHFYDDYQYPVIDTTNLSPKQAAARIMEIVGDVRNISI